MKCNKCPVSLACWANKLNNSMYNMYLCPACGYLFIKIRTNNRVKKYAVRCEERKLTHEIQRRCRAPDSRLYMIDGILQMPIKDPRDTGRVLIVRYCSNECMYSWMPLTKNIKITL